MCEIELYLDEEELLSKFNGVLVKLLRMNQGLTQNLKDWLAEPLKYYVGLMKRSRVIEQSEVLDIQELARKCQLLDDHFDYFDKEALLQLFKNKVPLKIEQYVKVLGGLLSKTIHESTLTLNKKYIKQVFGGDQNVVLKLIKDTLLWLLEKYKYDYTQD